LKPYLGSSGYLLVKISNGKVGVTHVMAHRVIAFALLPNPHNYPKVIFKNRIKTDTRPSNLMWAEGAHVTS